MGQVKGCRCGKQFVYLKTGKIKKNGKPAYMPVDYNSLSEEDKFNLTHNIPFNYDKTRHVSHFTTCPFANQFSGSKKKKNTERPPVPYKED